MESQINRLLVKQEQKVGLKLIKQLMNQLQLKSSVDKDLNQDTQ